MSISSVQRFRQGFHTRLKIIEWEQGSGGPEFLLRVTPSHADRLLKAQLNCTTTLMCKKSQDLGSDKNFPFFAFNSS